MRRTLLVLWVLLLHPAGQAQEGLVTLRSTVTGNRELPRVMYILPWQLPADATENYELRASFADELFEAVDRDEFLRTLQYRARVRAGESTTDNFLADH